MEILKRYTAIQIGAKRDGDDLRPTFNYGEITGPYYDLQEPEIRFDTEQEAIEYAYKNKPYASWLIVPVINFKH